MVSLGLEKFGEKKDQWDKRQKTILEHVPHPQLGICLFEQPALTFTRYRMGSLQEGGAGEHPPHLKGKNKEGYESEVKVVHKSQGKKNDGNTPYLGGSIVW